MGLTLRPTYLILFEKVLAILVLQEKNSLGFFERKFINNFCHSRLSRTGTTCIAHTEQETFEKAIIHLLMQIYNVC